MSPELIPRELLGKDAIVHLVEAVNEVSDTRTRLGRSANEHVCIPFKEEFGEITGGSEPDNVKHPRVHLIDTK